MRIALDGRFYRASTGGIGRYTRELVKNLLQIDSENQYFLFLTREDKDECHLYAPNLTIIETSIEHFTFEEQLRFPAVLAKVKPDITHFLNFNHPLGYKLPYITTIHDLTMNFFPVGRQKNPFLRYPYLLLEKHAATGAKAVIAPTNCVKQDIIKHLHVKQDNITVIYEGAQLPSTAIVRPQKSYLAKMGITKPYILFVSQWRPHKGLGVLIEAFGQIKQKHDIQLVVTGRANPQFPAIPAAIAASPRRTDIITPGFVDDEILDSLYAGAELFVFPSWYEGFGLPPLEAMARGIPVAASKTSVMPEVLGDAAAYFDPRQSANMAEVITNLLYNKELLKHYELLGRKQAAKYSWEKMARETLALYHRCVK